MTSVPTTDLGETNEAAPRSNTVLTILFGTLLIAGLIFTGRVSYLVFHSLVEIFSVAVAWSIFMLAWNARRYMKNDALLLLGMASLFVGGLDLIHMLAYKGINIFPGYDTDLPTQLWIAARYLQSLSLLAAIGLLTMPRRRAHGDTTTAVAIVVGYSLATSLLVWTIFARVFPACYVEGVGLTPFKRISEFVISALLLLAGVLLWLRRSAFTKWVVVLLLGFIGASVLSELAFTLYVGVTGLYNIIGHIFKVIAFYLLYRAIMYTGVDQAYAFVSRELQERVARLRSYIDHAPIGVYIADETGRYLEVNPAAAQMTGYTVDELLQMSIPDLLPPEALEVGLESFRQVVGTGSAGIEGPFRRKDGSIGYWLLDAVRLSPTRLMAFTTDISARRVAEANLQARTEEQQWLLESMINAFVIFESVFDAAGAFISYRFEYINHAYETITGVTLDQVKGKTVHEVWPGTEPSWIEAYGSVAVTGKAREFDMYHEPTGKLYHCRAYRPWNTQDRFCVVFDDVTEQRQAEQAIREREALLQEIFDILPIGLWLADRDGKLMRGNPAGVKIWGAEPLVPPSEYGVFKARRLPSREEIAPDDWALAHVIRDGVTVLDEMLEIDAFDGRRKIILNDVAPVLDDTGAIQGAIVVNRDITERMQAEEELRVSEERFRSIAEQFTDAIFLTDEQGVVTYISPAAESIFGYRPEEMVGHGFVDFLDEAAIPTAMAALRDTLARGAPTRNLSLCMKRKDGTTFAGEVNGSRYTTGASPAALGVIRDITDRRRADEERERLLRQVQEQVQRVQDILDTVPEGVLLISADGHILLVNPVAEQDLAMLSGAPAGAPVTRLGDRALADLLAAPPRGLWHELKAGARIFEVIARPLTDGPEALHYVLVINDVTHERQVRAELQQQERLAAVGQLAAGIAHDFNNILAVIVLYAQMDLQAKDLPDRFRAHINTIAQEAQHASHLVQQILDFGRRAMLEPRPMDFVPFLKEQTQLLARTLPESIKVELAYLTPEALVKADATRMQQMLTNLALNARDAMPDGGALQITLEDLIVEEDQVPPLPDIAPGAWVVLTIADTGTGMAPEALEHLFEPFYTTKEPGKGSGLGLAQVYGIVKQHDGHIDVHSETGHGTTFNIYLPAIDATPPPAEPEAPITLHHGNGEMILVVEDNPVLREAIVSALELLDYGTREAANGREALVILEREAAARKAAAQATGPTEPGHPISLVLSDMVMPDMGGQALFSALRDRGSQIPMVIMSGHPIQQQWQALQTQGLAGWLTKPLDIADVAEVLGRALNCR